MPNYFYLSNSSTDYVLDQTVTTLEISDTTRNYSISDFAGANGGAVIGYGRLSDKTITFSMKPKKDGTSTTAWNAARNALIAWFTKPVWETIYFNILNGEGTKTVRTQVYPQKRGGDKMKYYGVFDEVSFTFLAPSGTFQNTSATSTDTTVAKMTETSVAITNNGNCDTPIQLKFTPAGSATILRIELAYNMGVQLEKSNFAASSEIIYDTSNNSMTIGGAAVNPANYLTAGSGFNLQAGSNTLTVYCDSSGTFGYSYNERFI